ncbi:MAG: enoyl-ACP reductase [Chloroflexota bacterium]
MSLLNGKKALVFGVANKYSLAWAIAQELKSHGAEIGLCYSHERLERRVKSLAPEVDTDSIYLCDVTKDDDITALVQAVEKDWGKVDILVHSIAFADTEDLNNRYVETSRAGFLKAMEISVYSLVTLAQTFEPLMMDGGSIIALSYYGAEKVVPHYNVMGVAKAALEASVRYLASELGANNIRVNAISAGPVKTLSAGAFHGFRDMLSYVGNRTPLRRNIDRSEVAKSALYLLSDLSSGVTGEILHVDAGYNIMGMMEPIEED